MHGEIWNLKIIYHWKLELFSTPDYILIYTSKLNIISMIILFNTNTIIIVNHQLQINYSVHSLIIISQQWCHYLSVRTGLCRTKRIKEASFSLSLISSTSSFSHLHEDYLDEEVGRRGRDCLTTKRVHREEVESALIWRKRLFERFSALLCMARWSFLTKVQCMWRGTNICLQRLTNLSSTAVYVIKNNIMCSITLDR